MNPVRAVFAGCCLASLIVLAPVSVSAAELEAGVQVKIDAQLKQIQAWAAEAVVVKAVKDHNAQPPADHAAMTQEKWQTLTVVDPFVRSFSKNEAGQFLKTKKGDIVAEAFLSDASGCKVAFLSKTTSWCHKGKPKHDVPMTGKTWQGQPELDESTGLQLIQVAVPVLDGDKPIGSLVVGLSLAKLKE